MKTLYFTLKKGLKVMVIPDTQAHLDGHTKKYTVPHSVTADGQRELESEDVTDLIGHVSDVRDHPALRNKLDTKQ